jgi:EAL domain-containing protein (putative c-di-GMP-specific phosphodiesterase class I)
MAPTDRFGTSSEHHDSTLQPLFGRGTLVPLFQPIVDLQRGTVWGHEALIHGPADTPLHSPTALFGLTAAESRLVEFELHCVAVILEQWQALKDPRRLFLNMSANALIVALEGEHLSRIESVLARHQIDAKSVTVEITEHQGTGDIAALRSAVARLRAFGASVALDDFGEGHSSLRLWAELKPDFVKADKFFTQGISSDPYKLEFLRATAALGQTQGKTLIAEGVDKIEMMISAKSRRM